MTDCACDLRCDPTNPGQCSCGCHDWQQVVALYVDEKGPYANDRRFEIYGITRDARTYQGNRPCVCHPLCQRYGRMAKGSPGHQRYEVGDDGGGFVHCRDTVRRVGGVIEHPAGSHAYTMHGLPIPPKTGWSHPDPWGGRSCRIDQGAYGHPAKKATWLYAVLPHYPELDWTRVSGLAWIGGDGYHGKRERDRAKSSSKGIVKREQVPKDWNWRTPDRLKEVLYEMAASAIGWKPGVAVPLQAVLV